MIPLKFFFNLFSKSNAPIDVILLEDRLRLTNP